MTLFPALPGPEGPVEVLGLVRVELAVDRLTVESSRCGRGLGSSGQKTKVAVKLFSFNSSLPC